MNIILNSDGTWRESNNDDWGGCLIIFIFMLVSTGFFKTCGCSGCSSNHSSYNSSESEQVQYTIIGQTTVTTSVANIRTGPGTNYDCYKNAKGEQLQKRRGETLDVVEDAGKWYKVIAENDRFGYISKSLCTDIDEKNTGFSEIKEQDHVADLGRQGVEYNEEQESKSESMTEKETPRVDINKVHRIVDEPASYPMGEEAFSQFIQKYNRYPAIAKRKNISSGHARIEFIVERNGKVGYCKRIEVDDGGFGNEAIRLIKEAAPYQPAKIRGIAVRSYMDVSIYFYDNGNTFVQIH